MAVMRTPIVTGWRPGTGDLFAGFGGRGRRVARNRPRPDDPPPPSTSSGAYGSLFRAGGRGPFRRARCRSRRPLPSGYYPGRPRRPVFCGDATFTRRAPLSSPSTCPSVLNATACARTPHSSIQHTKTPINFRYDSISAPDRRGVTSHNEGR